MLQGVRMKKFNPLNIARAAKAVAQGKSSDMVLDSARKVIQSRIKDGRVVFITEERIEYVDKDGKRKQYSFEDMAGVFLDITGQRDHMAELGLGESDIEQIFREEYEEVSKNEA